MAGLPATDDPRLVVGPRTSDDAGAFLLGDGRVLLQTIDVITPIVDDPHLFGRIAATNALSDVYAMGGEPLTALNFLAFPADLSDEAGRAILAGGAAVVADAGAVIAGGHTIEDAELKYGMAVTGIVKEAALTPNAGARPGDALVLTKALGTGIVSTALKKGVIDESHAAYTAAVAAMTASNRAAAAAARDAGARGVTDVTGFGLGGHALEMAIASGVSIELVARDLPLLPDVRDLAAGGCLTGGGKKGAAWYAAHAEVPEAWSAVVFDPQTSGGLLIAVTAEAAAGLVARLPGARVVGRVLPAAAPRLRVVA